MVDGVITLDALALIMDLSLNWMLSNSGLLLTAKYIACNTPTQIQNTQKWNEQRCYLESKSTCTRKSLESSVENNHIRGERRGRGRGRRGGIRHIATFYREPFGRRIMGVAMLEESKPL